MSYTPKTIKLQEGGPAPLHDFLEQTREEFDASQFAQEEAARIQRGLDNRLTLHDAINNATKQQAMHTMLVGQEEDGPNGSETVYVDVPGETVYVKVPLDVFICAMPERTLVSVDNEHIGIR